MRKVIGIGETVLDIIFKNDKPMDAVPGGSVYNGIISLGRSGVPAMFISEVGNDRIGKKTIDFLETNGVDSSAVNMYKESKSPISLAFLNDKNDAEYLFYKDHPNDRIDFICPDIKRDDIIMIGSYFCINPVIRPQVSAILAQARSAGAIIYYDVNYRPSHSTEIMKLTSNILENFEYADIVRGSNEDFNVMYAMSDADKVYNSQISFYCKKFIYTNGALPVEVRGDGGFKKSYIVQTKPTVSTIGAGDNFNAGFVYGLMRYNVTRDIIDSGFSEELWDKVIACAMEFSSACCQSMVNYVGEDFGRKMKDALFLNAKEE